MSAPPETTPRAASSARGRITVIAGVNGAGKSSIVGATIRGAGGRYFNPDEVARALMRTNRTMTQDEANARAWELGRRGLERAIARREHFAFETTLGGRTITRLLFDALAADLEIVISYVGLDSPERHIARVRSRVSQGGHDIPEATIRQRFTTSRENLVALLPRLTELWVYDNSIESQIEQGTPPAPVLLLHAVCGALQYLAPKDRIPAWAHPIVAAAILSARVLQDKQDPADEKRTTRRRRKN